MKLKSFAIFGLMMLSLMLFAGALLAAGHFDHRAIIVPIIFAALMTITPFTLRHLNEVGALKVRDDLHAVRTIKATLTVATTKDTMYCINGMCALAINTALANAENVFLVGGMIEYAKATVTITGGQRAYWDSTAGKFTNAYASPCVLVGIFPYDAASGDATAFVVFFPRINGYGLQPKKAATVALTDAAATLTAAQLIYAGQFTITPSAGRALTVDTAALIVAGFSGAEVGDYFDFSIACLAAFAATVTTAAGITLVGSMAVNNASGIFRAEFTNVGAGTEAVTITRRS